MRHSLLGILIFWFSSLACALPPELYGNGLDRQELNALPTWEQFQKMMKQQKAQENTEGMAYVLSGAIAFAGGIVGYHNSHDVFAKGAYAMAQSLGVAAIGYGAYQYRIGDDNHLLYDTLNQQKTWSMAQKDQFVKVYFQLEKDRTAESQKVAAITHGLLAALNFYNASISSNEDLRSTLYFIGAINLLASISYSF